MTDPVCPCTEEPASKDSVLPNCVCPRDEHDIVVHEETCCLYKNEEIIHPHKVEVCQCVFSGDENLCKCYCSCPVNHCTCGKAGREVFDEWRSKRDVGAMPPVLESTHPLIKRFQETLKCFLEKENAIAEEEIIKLNDELQLSKQSYERDLETIYANDQDTNSQRLLIEEYEAIVAIKTAERLAAEIRARDAKQKYRNAKEKLEQNIIKEHEAIKEQEALTAICYQLKKWRDETDSDLIITQHLSDKISTEKKKLSDEKREIDLIIFGLSNEVWKLKSKLELIQKQMEIKNTELEKVIEKVTTYNSELDDIYLEKRRLVSLWNSILINIKQRDEVYDLVCDDYRILQENYHTLINSLEISKKMAMEEVNIGRKLAMKKEKISYEIANATKLFNMEDTKRNLLESQLTELVESMEMAERDEQLTKLENMAMTNILKGTDTEVHRRQGQKFKLENDILINIQEYLLNNKSFESMALGIQKIKEMSRKQEISLATLENKHAKILLDINVYHLKQKRNKIILEDNLSKVRQKEFEVKQLEAIYEHETLAHIRKQREYDIILKKYNVLKEMFDFKSPQERQIEELENQIKSQREKTKHMQQEWLRLQGHVIKLTSQYHKIITDINFVDKQFQLCEQKKMNIRSECSNINQEHAKIKRSLLMLQGKLEMLERSRKEAIEKNQNAVKSKEAITYEYSADLKDAETKIIQLEDDIEILEREKINLTQELDRLQREALTWQKKGIAAVELKRNLQNTKSAVGEVGLMKKEVHRKEVRKNQLLKTGEKLSQDLAFYVTRRETAMEKLRAVAAIENRRGSKAKMSQFNYHHKMRLARADLARVTKDIEDAVSHIKPLQQEKQQLEHEIINTAALNEQLEQHIAMLIKHCRDTECQKLRMLEQVVRSQRLGNELAIAIKRQSIKVKKPKSTVFSEYMNACSFNRTLKEILIMLLNEYPYLKEELEIISNTLDIHSPTDSPRPAECVSGENKGCKNNLNNQSTSLDRQSSVHLLRFTNECCCTTNKEDENIAEKLEE